MNPFFIRRPWTFRERAVLGGLIVGVLATVPLWMSEGHGVAHQIEAERVRPVVVPRACASGATGENAR